MISKTLPDGKTVQAFPLSIPQQFMYFMSKQYGARYPVNNIGIGCFFSGETDYDEMSAALLEAVERCDTMRLRFTRDEKYGILQYVTEKSGLKTDILDFSGVPLEEAKRQLLKISREEIPTFDCEIHRISLLKLENGRSGIFIKLHHFAMDAYSAGVFLRDAVEIYLHRTENAPYPRPMRPYIPALMTELSYINSAEQEADRDYWYRSLADTDEPVFTDYLLNSRLAEQQKENPGQRFADIHSGSPEAEALIFSMDAEESRKILSVCDEREISVCAFLSMALRTVLSAFNGNEEDVSFKMIINRRGSVSEKKSGGIRIGFLPMRSIISPDKTFIEGVNTVAGVQSEIYAHSSLGFGDMLVQRHRSMPSSAKPDSTYDSVGFSYQPLMRFPQIKGLTAENVWFNNGASMIPLYLTVKHRSTDEGFDFIFEYRKTPDPHKDLQVFYKKLREALITGAENPDILISDMLGQIRITDEERKS